MNIIPNIDFLITQILAISLTAILIPKFKITSIFGPFLTVSCLSLINSYYWDAALFFNIPDSLTIQTIVLVITNAAIFWILVKILPGIEVSGILASLVAPIVWSFSSIFINKYGSDIDWFKVFDFVLSMLTKIKSFIVS